VAKDWRTLKLEVLAETTQFVKGMDKANATTKSFGDKVGDFAKKAGVALAAVGAAAGAMAIKIGKEAIAAASDLAETTSKVNVIFGETAKNIEEFGAKAAASLGQTRTQAMNAAATFGIFGKSAGLAGEELTEFSTEFVQLASDLASFNNTSVDQAITALGAALRGESEPIRAYGVLLNDATLKAKALEMGIYSGTGTLSAQQKVLAAHKVILEQTRDAQGDFARTADGMANSQRILTARLEEAKIVLGTALLPIALQVVNLFNDRFLPVIERVAASFGGGEGLIAKVKAFVESARNTLNPILIALQDSFSKVSEAVETNRGNIASLLELVKTLYQFFVTYFVPILKNQVVSAIQGIGTAFSVVIKIVSPVIGFVSDAINGLLKLIDAAIQRINSLINAYNKISFLPNLPTISTGGAAPISPNIQLPFGGGSIGGGGATGGAAGILPTIPGIGGTSGGAAGTSSAAGTVAKAVETAANAAKKVVEEIVDMRPSLISVADVVARERGDIINYGVSAAPGAFDVARVRMGEAGITINVNAPTVIDEEGFSRAVVDALNVATNRGTSGGGGIRTQAQIL
jgi:hypothetical protein